MDQTIEMTTALEQSLSHLESARCASLISALSGNTLAPPLGESQGICRTCFIESETGQLRLLSWRSSVYLDVARAIMQSQMTKRGGTAYKEEDWPVALEFEGTANEACVEFCNTHSLISDLRRCLNKARATFSNVRGLRAEYDCFPADEYEEEGHIVIRVEVSSDQNTGFQEYDAYTDWMLNSMSDATLGFFILTVSRVE